MGQKGKEHLSVANGTTSSIAGGLEARGTVVLQSTTIHASEREHRALRQSIARIAYVGTQCRSHEEQ